MSYGLTTSPRIALAILGTALGIATACSDQREPTSPAARVTTRSSSTGAAAGMSLAPTSGQAKPTDQVGFTKITLVDNYVVVPAGGFAQVVAMCPVGSTVTGGGYSLGILNGGKPVVTHSRVITDGNQNGWSIGIDNSGAGTASNGVRTHGLCAS